MRGYREISASAAAAGISIGLVVAAIVAGFLYASQAEPTGVSDLVLSDKADRAMQANSSVETALIGLITSISTVLLTVAGVWAKNKFDTRKIERGELPDRRRSADRNGAPAKMRWPDTPMPDDKLPSAATSFYREGREFQRENIRLLDRIASTLERLDDRSETTHEALIKLLDRAR